MEAKNWVGNLCHYNSIFWISYKIFLSSHYDFSITESYTFIPFLNWIFPAGRRYNKDGKKQMEEIKTWGNHLPERLLSHISYRAIWRRAKKFLSRWIRHWPTISMPLWPIWHAMDGLGLKRGSVLGLHPIDPSQKRAAGFARAILQKRRSTPWDGVNLAKHGKVIDDKTEPGDMVVMDRTGVVVVPSGKIAEVGQ